MGKRYPAWIERWTRRAWTVAGQVGFGAALIITFERVKVRACVDRLRKRLENWGYRNVTLKTRSKKNG